MSVQTEGSNRSARRGRIALAVAGLGLGWLVGLSLSPVIGTVLTSILSIATGVVAGLTVLDLERPKLFDPWPVALLILGIAVGSPLGIMARTNQLFGPTFVDGRTDDMKGQVYSSSPNRPLTDRERAALSALFYADSETCLRLLGSPDSSLVSALLTSPLPWAPKLARAFEGDVKTMRRVVEVLCDR